MAKCSPFVITILWGLLCGCSGPLRAAPTAIVEIESPPASESSMSNQGPGLEATERGYGGGFAIFLLQEEMTIDGVSEIDLNELSLEQIPILSADDIVEYIWETHETKLLPAAYRRLAQLEKHTLSGPGLPFVVCVGTERIYGGMFWSSYSSVPYGGIVIDVYPAGSEQPVRIQTGYPSSDWFVGEDLRDDPRIFKSLEDGGLLHEGGDP